MAELESGSDALRHYAEAVSRLVAVDPYRQQFERARTIMGNLIWSGQRLNMVMGAAPRHFNGRRYEAGSDEMQLHLEVVRLIRHPRSRIDQACFCNVRLWFKPVYRIDRRPGESVRSWLSRIDDMPQLDQIDAIVHEQDRLADLYWRAMWAQLWYCRWLNEWAGKVADKAKAHYSEQLQELQAMAA
jgi:hypothetical protein